MVWLIYPADKSLSTMNKHNLNVLSCKEDRDLLLNLYLLNIILKATQFLELQCFRLLRCSVFAMYAS